MRSFLWNKTFGSEFYCGTCFLEILLALLGTFAVVWQFFSPSMTIIFVASSTLGAGLGRRLNIDNYKSTQQQTLQSISHFSYGCIKHPRREFSLLMRLISFQGNWTAVDLTQIQATIQFSWLGKGRAKIGGHRFSAVGFIFYAHFDDEIQWSSRRSSSGPIGFQYPWTYHNSARLCEVLCLSDQGQALEKRRLSCSRQCSRALCLGYCGSSSCNL